MQRLDLSNPRNLSLVAMMTALVLALTRSAVPNAVGYNHLGDIAIFFTAFAFGPWAALIAGGLGTALADVLGGYAQFAPLSFVVHGLQGFVAGWLYAKRPTTLGLILATVIGGVVVVAGYFAGESLIPALGGPSKAVLEIAPNVLQVLIGAIGAVVYILVAQAYPRLRPSESD